MSVLSTVNIICAIISLVAAMIYGNHTQFFVQKLNELLHWKSGCNPIGSVGNVSLHSFAVRGPAEPIRMLMTDTGIPFHEVTITNEIMDVSMYTFGHVPAIITSANVKLVERRVILHYLGRSVGMDCDCRDLSFCDIIAAGVDELHAKRVALLKLDTPDVTPQALKERYQQYCHRTVLEWWGLFEDLAPTRSSDMEGLYFASERQTWADYLIFDMIESNLNFCRSKLDTHPHMLSDLPKLSKFYTYFAELLTVRAYVNSGNRFPANVECLEYGTCDLWSDLNDS